MYLREREVGNLVAAQASGFHVVTKRTALAASAVAAFVILPALATLRLPLGPDEVGLVLYPLKLSEGLVIHRDFFSPYGPGGNRVVQGVFAVFGPSITVERCVGIAYHLLIALGLFVLARPLGRVPATAAGLTCAVCFLWFAPAAYAWFGGLALAVGSLALLANSRRPAVAVIAGALAGLIPFWRPEMAILWLAAVPLCVATHRKLAYVVGLAVGAIPVAAHLATAGISVFANAIASRLSVNGQTSLTNVDAKVWILLGLSVLGIGVQFWCSHSSATQRPLFLSTAILGTLLMPQALQRTDVYHTIYAACVILPMTAATLISRLDAGLVARTLTPLRLVAAATAVGVSVAVGSLLIYQLPWSTLESAGRALPVTPDSRQRLSQVMATLRSHVKPGSKVFMGSQDMSRPGVNDNELYYLLPEYRSPFFYLELAPGASERAGSPLVQDILSADALVLRDTPREATDSEYPNVTPGVQDANEIVKANFCLVDTVGVSQIYVRGTC
ncbi:hypothetical protein [Terrabacter sp. Root181]|uniref:hypothetical protein n=1 Tax=Terrabacter sp. Root181 TaxID=1736484 RepID=UPI0006FCD744|nr:hypothetical protein [Terrabacter sp. Root181]KRB43853.1 hypothetical protein ASD90_19760 [Terrabacter sp. Root181]